MIKEAPVRLAKQVVLGTMLGDGNLSLVGHDKARLCLGHSVVQLEYLLWKTQMISPLVGSFDLDLRHRLCYSKNIMASAKTLSSVYLKHIYDDFYFEREGKVQKEVHINILNRLTPLSIATWYMDDGCLVIYKTRGKNAGKLIPWAVSFATHSFSYEENQLICQYFKDKWQMDFHILKQDGSWFIRSSKEDTQKFIDLIESYIPECMQYKIDSSYQRTKHPKLDDDVLRTLQGCKELVRNSQSLTYKNQLVFV